MALRAFHANPSIGGFGDESAPSLLVAGDRKQRTLQHLGTENSQNFGVTQESGDAFCQIVKELVDNAVDACETARKNGTATAKKYRVKVEILPHKDDNTTLQVTVSDNGIGMGNIQGCVNAFHSTKGSNHTAGRYGIGLTLCLLHAQRLVPGSYSCITSATQESKTFTRALYIVDTAGDKVECHREEEVPKTTPKESGTCVSVLVPGGTMASMAWKRVAIYISRFRLSSVRCSIEVLAPTISSLPLFVQRQEWPPMSGSNIKNDAKWHLAEALDSQEDEEAVCDREELNKAQKAAEGRFLFQRQALVHSSQTYEFFELPIKLQNVAYSETPIRIVGAKPTPQDFTTCTPSLEVSVVVSPQEESTQTDSRQPGAVLELVRMVNFVPLLDGAEACACGLVKAIQNRTTWGVFGLTVENTLAENDHSDNQDTSWVQHFGLRDSDQVAPYYQSHNHQLWEAENRSKGGRTCDFADIKKRKGEPELFTMPAKVRLGRVLVIVNIRAAPSMLPLPTLSKGRLPVNHTPIFQSLQVALRGCLRSLQLTSPGLLLTPSQLHTVERDIRYIPLLANAASRIIDRVADREKQLNLLEKLSRFHLEDKDISNDGVQLEDGVVDVLERRIANVVRVNQLAKDRNRRRKKRRIPDVTAGDYKDLENSDSSSSDGEASKMSILGETQSGRLADSQPTTCTSEMASTAFSSSQEASTPLSVKRQKIGSLGGYDIDDDDWW